MRTKTLTVSTTIFLSVLFGWAIWQARSGPESVSEPVEIAHEALPRTAPDSSAKPVTLPNLEANEEDLAEAEIEASSEQKRRALIQADPELHDRARQQSLQKKAEARWTKAVDEGEYSADDLDPSIRQFFSDVGLEPRYAEDGLITGLVIQDLQDDHPLAVAGFHVGDRLSRIQGVALRYPEEIPSLLARLGPNFSVCRATGEQGDVERCEEFALH